MFGLMQDWPLLLHKVIDYAASQFPDHGVVSRLVEGPIDRTSFTDVRARSLRVAQRLSRDGVREGDRIATLAWNSMRHLETWYGITGIGAIYHTINPRLFPEQIAWIVNHAQDRLLFTDLTFLPLLDALHDRLPSVERYIVLTDAAHMPETRLRNAVAYDDWLAEADGDFRWLTFDERTAAGLCYTSGTTGDPKGVLYTHRSNTLHALSLLGVGQFAISAADTCLLVVPMFHANSWSLAFACPMAGANMVMPGPKLDGASLHALMEAEQVTFAAAVPTIWLALLNYLETTGHRLSSLRRVAIGGSACPRIIIETFEEKYGVTVIHAWGMTELSPVGTTGVIKPKLRAAQGKTLYDLKEKQGFPFFGVELEIFDGDNRILPHDGVTFGRLKASGVACTSGYYRGETASVLDDGGFFDTGDIATIDPDGYVAITDRAKDVIKSGGEWISSIEIENIAVGHADVLEAAVIGVPHPRWGERPLLILVAKPGHGLDGDAVLGFLGGKIAKWWMPDAVEIVADIPHTAAGKINKVKLRDLMRDYRLPTR